MLLLVHPKQKQKLFLQDHSPVLRKTVVQMMMMVMMMVVVVMVMVMVMFMVMMVMITVMMMMKLLVHLVCSFHYV
jgi:hypothetical protein